MKVITKNNKSTRKWRRKQMRDEKKKKEIVSITIKKKTVNKE